MQTIAMNGEIRSALGKGGARRSRVVGKIPGVLYGPGEPSVAINLDSRQFEKVLRRHASGNFILDLRLAGREGEELKALIKEVQRDPVSSRVIHVDLQHVSLTQKVRVHVPIHLLGTAIGVKEGGILEHFVRDVEIECLALQIPDSIDVDITDLTRGHSLHVSDLVAPEGVAVITPGDRVIAGVVAKAIEEAPAPAAEAEAAPGETPAAETKAAE